MSSVGDILDYKKNENEDYYAILGCNENSSVSLYLFLLIRFVMFDFEWLQVVDICGK